MKAIDVPDAARELDRIIDLKYRYARALDDMDWQALRRCLADDIEFLVPSTGALHGAELTVATLEEHFTKFAFTLHECTMPQLALLSPSTARGLWYIHTITITHEEMRASSPRKIHGYGKYNETYEKGPEGWRIAKLELVSRFKDKAQ